MPARIQQARGKTIPRSVTDGKVGQRLALVVGSKRASAAPMLALIKHDLKGRGAACPTLSANYFGARLARMRCSVRRCIFSRRAVSETLRLHIS
jgi:hypothetical protein